MPASEMKHQELRVEVRGPEHTSNTFICKVIADCFREAGLTHLEVISQHGDDIDDDIPTNDFLKVARIRNPFLDLAGIAICPEGQVVDEVTVFDNPDRMEDDSDNDVEVEPDFDFADEY